MAENVGGTTGYVGDVIRSAWRGLWWDMLLLSVVAIIFGLLLFFMPGLSIAVFVLLFGLYAFAVGLLLLLQTVTVKDGNWWVRLLGSIVAFAAGAAVFLWPGISALSLLYVIAFYFILIGVLQVDLVHRVAQGDLGRVAVLYQRYPFGHRRCPVDNEAPDRGHRPGADDRHLRHRLRRTDWLARVQAPGNHGQGCRACLKVVSGTLRVPHQYFLF